MSVIQQTISPIDGSVYVERALATATEIANALRRAETAQKRWKQVPIAERAEICRKIVQHLLSKREALGAEITWQMGRPIRYTPNEINRMAERAETMIAFAEETLADIPLEKMEGFTRFIRREPLGVVFAIIPWNYPYLTAVNSFIPAIMAGNTILLKHSPQTPLCAERIAEACKSAGLPEGVFQSLHLSIEDTQKIVQSPEVDFVTFTGSVSVGRAIQKIVSDRFIGVGLELGGKDPGYVRADANLDHAVENLIDGAFFNSGQSCCAIERLYVHADLYDAFVEKAVALTRTYTLGNPLETEVTLGPMVRTQSADFVRGQIAEAIQQGANPLIDESEFPASQVGTPYLAPQILVNVNHSMRVMAEESFGPVVGIMKVGSDAEAIHLMNDSNFGLTAAIWTMDEIAALEIGDQLETGTCFMNCCDYLDPGLAWTGVKTPDGGVASHASGMNISLARNRFIFAPKSNKDN